MQQDKRWAGAGPPVGDTEPPDLDVVRCALLGLARAVAESPDVSGRLTLRSMGVWRQFQPPIKWAESKESRVFDRQPELAHHRIESGRFLEVADVPSPGNDREPCTGDRVVHLVRHGHR